MNEQVFVVPPWSTAKLEKVGVALRAMIDPDGASQAGPLDWVQFVDVRALAEYRLHIDPVEDSELPDAEGDTSPYGEDTALIRLRETVYDGIFQKPRPFTRSVATLAHELAHAALHINYLRKMAERAARQPQFSMKRALRSDIPAYLDPEWQAWCLAGCMVAPRELLLSLPKAERTVFGAAARFGCSPAFMVAHLQRLKLIKRANG